MMYSLTRRGALAAGAAVVAAPALARAASPADLAFEALGARWLDGMLRQSPIGATEIGDHRFDSRIDDLSPAGMTAGAEFNRKILVDLSAIDRAALSEGSRVDAALLENRLKHELWTHETLRPFEWDPLIYSGLVGAALYSLMARDYAPLPDRLRAAGERMDALPGLLAQARANLVIARVPKVHAETAAKQNKGILSVVDGQILPNVHLLSREERRSLELAAEKLRTAINEQQVWLDKALVPGATGDFRLGDEQFDAKLAFTLNSRLTRAQIRERAEAAVKSLRGRMYEIARGLVAGDPAAPAAPAEPTEVQQQAVIERALEKAYAAHPPRGEVAPAAKAALAQATEFVRRKDLITLPASPVQVVLMAEFRRGVAVADCDSPGPLDKGQATYVEVSPIPPDWSEAQANSFLREYNGRAIHELIVHEAMPGHYVQLAHSNTYPSVLRAVLHSGAFIEGWGMYAEDVMADAGYLNGDPLYLLVHLKWILRATMNALVDQAVHVDGASRERVMTMLTKTAFQEEREAAGKWIRAQVSSTQLSTYFVGYSEHWELRKLAEQRWGAGFNLKRYHDQALSYGSPPVRFVRGLMFGEG